MGPVGLAAQAAAGQAPLTERIRAFFAVALPARQRDLLGGFLETCAGAAPEFRWTSRDNLHLTLRFVGSVERAVVEAVAERITLQSGPAFSMALGDIGTFRRGRLARVVWQGVREGSERIQHLARLLETECVAAGLEPETRAFKPHLTLARARPRDGAALPELPALPGLEPWIVREVILFSSHLGRDGAVHEPIATVPLAD